MERALESSLARKEASRHRVVTIYHREVLPSHRSRHQCFVLRVRAYEAEKEEVVAVEVGKGRERLSILYV